MRQQVSVFIFYYSSGDWWKELEEGDLISLPNIRVLLDYVTLSFSTFGTFP